MRYFSYLRNISWAWRPQLFLGLTCALIILLMIGCAEPGQKGVTPAEGVMFTCETYADTLMQLSELNAAGKIKKAHQDLVDGVVETLHPVCTGKAPDVNSTVKDVAVDNGVKILKTVLLISLGTGG